MPMKGRNHGMKNWSQERIIENSIRLNNELNDMYRLISQMVVVCLRKGLRLVIENPYTPQLGL